MDKSEIFLTLSERHYDPATPLELGTIGGADLVLSWDGMTLREALAFLQANGCVLRSEAERLRLRELEEQGEANQRPD